MTEAVLERSALEADVALEEEAATAGADQPLEDAKLSEGSKIGKRNKALGARGEEAAARFLYRRGYEILERNWKCFAGEADIIAKDDETLVFIEVKTRKDCERGFPSEAVTAEKRTRYERIALAYLADCARSDFPVRFDVVSIVIIGPDKAMIRHQINAFSAA